MMRPQQATTANLMRWATYASVATASILIVVKVIAWFMTDSISILATLIDSSLDILASVINLLAVRHALQPADDEHRFGHGKAEALSGVGQALFIAGSAIFLLLQAAGRLFHPQQTIQAFDVGISVMVFSIIATVMLLSFQHYVIRKTNSTAIKADALHYKTDLLVNTSVIIALLLSVYGSAYFDAIFGIGIAIYILYSAWHIVIESIDLLMDHEIEPDQRQQIVTLIETHPNAIGYHDLRTRRSGNTVFVQFHLELDQQQSLLSAHAIADQLEQQISQLFDQTEVIIHEDPVQAK